MLVAFHARLKEELTIDRYWFQRQDGQETWTAKTAFQAVGNTG
jgi:hypothetical protein